MRIVYDDTMQKEVCNIVRDAILWWNKHDMAWAVKYDYGMHRVQKSLVKQRFAGILEDYNMEIGNTVSHANGIGNNCCYPIYYYAENELQHCANININSGLYSEVYVYLTDYNNKRISSSYKLTPYGITLS